MIPETTIRNIKPNTQISARTVAVLSVLYDDQNYTYDDLRLSYDGIFGYETNDTPITRVQSMILDAKIV